VRDETNSTRVDLRRSHGWLLLASLAVGATALVAVLAYTLISVPRSAPGSGYTPAWILLGALIGTIALAIVLGWRAAQRSAQLARTGERARAAERLAHHRLHDELTGLPNRALFIDRAQHALAAQRRHGQALAVMFLDVDRFKRINDSIGHRLGDRLLATVAYRLESALRPTDTVSRFGGDEFMVLCPAVDGAEQALDLARRIEMTIDQPMRLVDRRLIQITTSIGIALHTAEDEDLDADALIARADAAMYAAKAAPGTHVQLYDAARHHTGRQQLDFEVALRTAIANDEIAVYYQPIVDLNSGSVRGVEALARWRHPERGLLLPLEFIPLAEECGLIAELGRCVLRRACGDLAAWRDASFVEPEFLLSVNVSVRQLDEHDFVDSFRAVLDETAIPPENVCVEITESAVMSAPERSIAALNELRSLGVALAIDDFGTGQTSLAQVAYLPIEELKLDRSFVAQLPEPRDAAIVETVATLAGALGFSAVAEGVETSQQAELLADLGYPLAQGFHFARPESGDSMLRRFRRRAAVTVD
jgi:diguanylate cyclase (GGDEF)-like protein